MKKTLLLIAALSVVACKPAESPREQLAKRLSAFVQEGKIAYGHQDDLSYGHAWRVTDWENDPLDRSDVKDVAGQYPMVLGMDLGGIELGNDANLDGVPFGLMRKAARLHTERGGIVTLSWHPRNPFTGGDAWDVSSDKVVESILPGGEKAEEFALWLQRAADFVESIGPDVPIIFRPWHENVASWFWWGGKLCSAEQYKQLFQLTWKYFTQERSLGNILWCYSPNSNITMEEYMERYPGDDYVDILGMDDYSFVGPAGVEEAAIRFRNAVKAELTELAAVAAEHSKLVCFSETGQESLPDPTWWTETLLPSIKDFPICYVLTWRNAHDNPRHFYAPWKGFENEADFKAFADDPVTVFID